MKKLFNWLAGHSKHSFTLARFGRALLTQVPTMSSGRKVSFHEVLCETHRDSFIRSARVAERSVTLSGLFYAAAVGTSIGGPLGAAASVGVAVIAKTAGLAAAGVAYMATTRIDRILSPEAQPRYWSRNH